MNLLEPHTLSDIFGDRATNTDEHGDSALWSWLCSVASTGLLIVAGGGRVVGCNRQFLACWGWPQDKTPPSDLVTWHSWFEQRVEMPPRTVDRARGWAEIFVPGGQVEVCLRGDCRLEVDIRELLTRTEAVHIWTVRDLTGRWIEEEGAKHWAAPLPTKDSIAARSLEVGGIAHDVQNNLCRVMLGAELALARVERDCDCHDLLTMVVRSAQSARELLWKLQYGVRDEAARHTEVDLTAVVAEVVSLCSPGLPRNVSLHEKVTALAPCVRGARDQLRRVVENLVQNAIHAIGSRPGNVVVELGTARVDSVRAGLPGGAPGGDYVVLAVRDNGPGMSAEAQARLFQPYFTTKATGTGLGLVVVSKIAHEHGGFVHVESAPGCGSVFRVYLPWLAR